MKTLLALAVMLACIPGLSAVELETYVSKGNPRTHGVDFSIGRPKSWVPRLGLSSGTIAAFWKSPTGLVDSMSIIFPRTASEQKESVTKEEFREIFENPQLEQLLGKTLVNAKFVRKVSLDDHKYPAGFLEYRAQYKLRSGEADIRIRNYLVYLGNTMVQIQFHLVQEGGEDRFVEFDDEMSAIIDSLVHLRE